MTRQLPPLASLRAFEAAARHLSFKQAAEELGVTPTAISHQIRQLECYLGQPLFERHPRQVKLTPGAQNLYWVLRDGFDAFGRAVEEVMRQPRRAVVTLTATHAFAARWLVPRLARFQTIHPEIDLRLLATDEILPLGPAGADLAIRYGRSGISQAAAATPLFVDRYAPVAHPCLNLRAPEDLANHPLLHFEWCKPHPTNPTWPRWFKEAGMPAPTSASLHFSDEAHAIQAALAGHGVALLSIVLVADDIASGALVHPFGPVLNSKTCYLMQAKDRVDDPALAAVRAWLLEEARRPLPDPAGPRSAQLDG